MKPRLTELDMSNYDDEGYPVLKVSFSPIAHPAEFGKLFSKFLYEDISIYEDEQGRTIIEKAN